VKPWDDIVKRNQLIKAWEVGPTVHTRCVYMYLGAWSAMKWLLNDIDELSSSVARAIPAGWRFVITAR